MPQKEIEVTAVNTAEQAVERLRTAGVSGSDASIAVDKLVNWWTLPKEIEVTLVFKNPDDRKDQ